MQIFRQAAFLTGLHPWLDKTGWVGVVWLMNNVFTEAWFCQNLIVLFNWHDPFTSIVSICSLTGLSMSKMNGRLWCEGTSSLFFSPLGQSQCTCIEWVETLSQFKASYAVWSQGCPAILECFSQTKCAMGCLSLSVSVCFCSLCFVYLSFVFFPVITLQPPVKPFSSRGVP